MRGASDMQTPVPCGTDSQGLCVQRVIPATADNLDPALHVAGQVDLPGTPGPLALFGHVLQRHRVPAEPAV